MTTIKAITKTLLKPTVAKKTVASSSLFCLRESSRQYSDAKRNAFDREIDSTVDKVVFKLRTEGRKGVKDVMNSFRKAQEYLDMKQLKEERQKDRKERGIKEEHEEQLNSVNKE
jgi:putative protein kinase ArgK-like GTPase of G3E family